jgi:aspartate/methionine/tyrosine aminotransferase
MKEAPDTTYREERMSDGRAKSLDEAARVAVPLDREAVDRIAERMGIDIRSASIREMNNLIDAVESELGLPFVRMEFGIPGLPVSDIAVKAEAEALAERQVGHIYAPFEGVPRLKEQASRFVKAFMDLDRPPTSCIPTVGAMQGCFASILLAGRLRLDRRTLLLLEPGFPVNRQQVRLLGLESATIDLYDHRGDRLVRAVEERVGRGDVCGILWSSPNNPSWIALKESELDGIGRVCDRHDVLAIEDLAYFGMDMRQDYLTPNQAPFQPTVARYTDRAVCIISSSKLFSYAGQRVAINIMSPTFMEADYPDLQPYFGTSRVGHAFLHGGLYPVTASVPESPQYGLAALLEAACDGDRTLFAPAFEYARRAREMKKMFLANGFRLVYDNDLGRPLADGFYFTVSYPEFEHGADLLHELLPYGISAITLETTGSVRVEGLRACVSLVSDELLPVLAERLERFHRDRQR